MLFKFCISIRLPGFHGSLGNGNMWLTQTDPPLYILVAVAVAAVVVAAAAVAAPGLDGRCHHTKNSLWGKTNLYIWLFAALFSKALAKRV